MPAADILTFTPRTTPRVADYFRRLDAQLAEFTDRGYAACYLWQQIDKWNALAERQAEWVARGCNGPNPVGPEADAFEVTSTLAGLYSRSRQMQAAAKARLEGIIAEALS